MRYFLNLQAQKSAIEKHLTKQVLAYDAKIVQSRPAPKILTQTTRGKTDRDYRRGAIAYRNKLIIIGAR